jgi:tRNA(fMet)-specific endonuclease VapC
MAMLDTNTCVYAMRGSAGFSPKLALRDCAISTIVLGELEYGVNHSQHLEKNRAALDAFLNAVQIFSLEPEAGEHYGRIRALLASEGQLIGNNDMWIAAHARSLGLALITHNRSEFSRVPDLVIDSWMND